MGHGTPHYTEFLADSHIQLRKHPLAFHLQLIWTYWAWSRLSDIWNLFEHFLTLVKSLRNTFLKSFNSYIRIVIRKLSTRPCKCVVLTLCSQGNYHKILSTTLSKRNRWLLENFVRLAGTFLFQNSCFICVWLHLDAFMYSFHYVVLLHWIILMDYTIILDYTNQDRITLDHGSLVIETWGVLKNSSVLWFHGR